MDQNRRRDRVVWIASFAGSICLLVLPLIFKLNGKAHADWQQFLGRFHPLVVHLPIGLILLVPVLEIAGRKRPALHEASGFVLKLALIGSATAVALGFLLAYGGGSTGPGVTRHMWGGIALTLSVLACLLVRPWWAPRSEMTALRNLYPALLVGVLGLLAWTAHQGGSLTHGDTYLFEYLPAPLKSVPLFAPHKEDSSITPDAFYAKHIHPILDANCVACHGESKTQGGLRLDSYARLMKGGEGGPVIVPGQPDKSILMQRITLPVGHKQFMPAEGKPPLSAEEIAWLRAWIEQGASPVLTSLAGVVIHEPMRDAPLPQVEDYSGRISEMEQSAKSEGAALLPVSQNLRDGLVLETVNAGAKFGDAQLLALQRFAPYIVEAELGRTSVSDASLDTLSRFKHLRALHLEGTSITGAGLARLTGLSELTYLNLSETKVTQADLAPVKSMKNLAHLYLYDTPAQPVAAATTEQSATRKKP